MERSSPFIISPPERRPDSPTGVPFKLLARDTAGLLSIHEWSLDAWKSGPRLHAHNFDEAFFVLTGELEMQIGDERHVLGERYLAWVPRHTRHTFANAGPQRVVVMTIATPGGLENYFATEAGDPGADLGDMEVEFFGPPIRSKGAPET